MELSIFGLNLFYAVMGAVFTLVFMVLGYGLFDRVTPFKTGVELQKGNVAVGLVVGSVFVALGIAIGLVMGMALN